MKTLKRSLACLTFAALCGAATGAPSANLEAVVDPVNAALLAALEDEDEVPDKRDDIKYMRKTFEGHLTKKGKEDADAIAVLDMLLKEYEGCGPKDKADIVKSLQKGFGLKRKENRDGTAANTVAMASAVCLSKMAPESVKSLDKLCFDKKVTSDPAVHRQVILSLGKTEDESAVDTLLKLTSSKDAKIQGAAIESLGRFRAIDQKERKEVCERLIKIIMPIKSTVDSDSEDIIARERYDVIGPPTITTLQKLTDQKIRDFQEWQQWWNKNKRNDWDEEED